MVNLYTKKCQHKADIFLQKLKANLKLDDEQY